MKQYIKYVILIILNRYDIFSLSDEYSVKKSDLLNMLVEI